MQDFKNLVVWRKSHDLVLEVYRLSRRLPPEERYGLTQQMRTAAVSIASNLAEGSGRAGDAEFRRFGYMALGSCCELEYLVLLAQDLEYLGTADFNTATRLREEVRRMLVAFLRRLESCLARQGSRRK